MFNIANIIKSVVSKFTAQKSETTVPAKVESVPTIEIKPVFQGITREQYLMGRDKEYPTTDAMNANVDTLLKCVNALLKEYCEVNKVKLPGVNSGYRPGKYNVAAGGAPRSSHLTCEAVDMGDIGQRLSGWIRNTPGTLEKYGLWMEDPRSTPSWCHLQTRPVSVRIFKP